MAGPLETGLKRATYSAGQLARIGWYSLHYFAGRHMIGPVSAPGEVPFAAKSPPADLAVLQKTFQKLFRDEWQMIDAGIYKVPRELRQLPDFNRLLRQSRDYMREAKAVSTRAHRQRGHSEVLDDAALEKYPRYYLQNFHYQSGGWLSEESARIYDTQVETLFTGAAGPMRRQALPFIRDELVRINAQGGGPAHLVDLACGTAPLLGHIKDNFPDVMATAIDLSPDYLSEAKKRLSGARGITFVQGQAEAMPLQEESADMVLSVYLFHELPPKVRRHVAQEIARVLKRGGLYIHVDTLQYGDTPALDILLESFPHAFHEPYYDSYCKEDLAGLFAEAGLKAAPQKSGFLTKVSAFRKV